jgi:hypothetical protein
VSFDIRLVPTIMRQRGWTQGAALQDRWFSLLPCTKPNYCLPPDTTTVTMGWVLQYDRAKATYAEIFSKELWKTENARKALLRTLTEKGVLPTTVPKAFPLGGNYANQGTDTLDSFSTQYHSFKSSPLGDPLDGLYGALGSFTFKLVVCGQVSPVKEKPGKYTVAVDKVGVYVRDSFDFNDDGFISQPLGYWSAKHMDVSKSPGTDFEYVTNADYRAWRDKHSRGGDFLVFSDVVYTAVGKSFELP